MKVGFWEVEYITDVEKFEISPRVEEFQIFHTTDVEKSDILPNLEEFQNSTHDIWLWNLFCRILRAFAWKKNGAKNCIGEVKWQIWGMVSSLFGAPVAIMCHQQVAPPDDQILNECKFRNLEDLWWVLYWYRYQEFFVLTGGIGKIWYRKKFQNRYRKNLVLKKVLVSVSKIFGTGKSIGIGIV